MFRNLYKKVLTENEFSIQKCYLPIDELRSSQINVGDFVSVNCGAYNCICRIFPLLNPENCVAIDETVTYRNVYANVTNKELLNFPLDFTSIKVSVIKKLEIRIVLQTVICSAIPTLEQYSKVISKLFHNYVVKINAVVKCDALELANLLNIKCFIVKDTLFEDNSKIRDSSYGRITGRTVIEVTGFLSLKQFQISKQFEMITLGGFSDAFELLKLSLKVSTRILLLGPSGSGKSTLIKKFCSDLNCFLFIIDGFSKLSLEKCNAYITALVKLKNVLSDIPVILFVDNLDQMLKNDPSKAKKVDQSNFLTHLIDTLNKEGIFILGAVPHKGLLNACFINFFDTEIFIGSLSISQRKEMLEVLMKRYDIFGIDYNYLAEKMPGFTANDVETMTKTVLLCAALQGKKYDDVSTEDFETVLLKMTPSLLKNSKFGLNVQPIYWKDIGGMKSIKQRLQLCIEKPLLNPEIFKKVDLPIPRGVLLFGPPGCCKTTIARGLATECKANFFAANSAQIYSKYVGESEKNISELFFEARLCAPSIVFLDEIDSIVGRRAFGSKEVGVAEKVLSTLLSEMDGFGISTVYGGCEDPHKVLSYCGSDETDDCEERISDQVIVVGATNRPDLIDDALLRPGRFDMIVYVPPPNAEERESILRTFTDGGPLHNVDLKMIAEKSEHLSGADLKHLYNTAGRIALRQNESIEYITDEHFMKALEKVKPSITLEQIKMYEKLSSRYGTFIR